VIPYQQARSIILQNPESISVGECACRAAAETACLPQGQRDVCLFVGDPHASFIGEFNPDFRKISQDEAVGVLEGRPRQELRPLRLLQEGHGPEVLRHLQLL
jgi:hypothetical protein